MKIKGKIYLQITGLILIGFLLSLTGCMTSQLSQFKKHYDSQEYIWIAEQEVSCAASEEGCNQLHLIKGNACYELATHGQSPLRYFECSATHLEMGIDQTRQWQLAKFNLNRPQNYENLCESLRKWRDLEKGEKATQINQLLLVTSQKFLAAEPGNLSAIFFLENARYAKLHPCLLHPESCPSLCEDLTAIMLHLSQNAPRARATKYEPNYGVLIKELSKEKELARCP